MNYFSKYHSLEKECGVIWIEEDEDFEKWLLIAFKEVCACEKQYEDIWGKWFGR